MDYRLVTLLIGLLVYLVCRLLSSWIITVCVVSLFADGSNTRPTLTHAKMTGSTKGSSGTKTGKNVLTFTSELECNKCRGEMRVPVITSSVCRLGVKFVSITSGWVVQLKGPMLQQQSHDCTNYTS